MLDIRFVEENPDLVQINADQKGYQVNIKQILDLNQRRRHLSRQVDEKRTERNSLAQALKNQKPNPEQIALGKQIKQDLSAIESELRQVEAEFWQQFKQIPNMALDDVPIGASEDDNQVAKVVGELPKFDFEPQNHAQIAEARGWLDKQRAAKVTGSRFAYLRGDLVKLQLAITQFVFDQLSDSTVIAQIIKNANLTDVSSNPFTPILPPFLIRTEAYDAMDRLEPRDDRYKIENEELWLQGSAEHVLGSMHAGEIFASQDLPLRYVGLATSFRREAGTYGKDMEGILRMHQFDKLEMESFTTPSDGFKEHLLFVAIQEYLLQQLELPYRVVQKCSADIGKPNARGIDMEVWLPGQNKYRETHTADYMTDYQARRLKTRVRMPAGDLQLVHTNDATAFALGRIMIGIIENNQTADQTVRLPKVLQNYLGGRQEL